MRREIELGTGYTTCTDHGTLANCPTVYALAQKNNLISILGQEIYYRSDDDDPILPKFGIPKDDKGTYASYHKYGHLTIHAADQQAYETMCRLSSAAEQRAERHGSERKPLWNWRQLEELCGQNITVGSGCLVGIIGRSLLLGRADIAEAYYAALRGIVRPGNWMVEVMPHRCNTNWVKGVFFQPANKTDPLRFWTGKKLRITLAGGEVWEGAADEFARLWTKIISGRGSATATLTATKNYNTWQDLPEAYEIVSVKSVEGYVANECSPLAPDGALQTGMNQFMLGLAHKYGDPVLCSEDAHLAYPADKPVQDVRLMSGGDSWRMSETYDRQSSLDAFGHFQEYLHTTQKEFEGWVENSYAWAGKFGWKWQARKQLPAHFYPTDTLKHTMELIRQVGRMRWDNAEWRARLTKEITMIHKNGVIDLLPYFFVCHEVADLYEKNGLLTGMARGSAGGVLLSYLLGITHINPLRYGLSMERFLTTTRIRGNSMPDIDNDSADRSILLGGDVEQLDVEMEDGTSRRVLKSQKVHTDQGDMLVAEAMSKGLDVTGWFDEN